MLVMKKKSFLNFDKNGESVLDNYLKSVIKKNFSFKNLEEANMYLAEDRILCLKIYAKYGACYTLQYMFYYYTSYVIHYNVLSECGMCCTYDVFCCTIKLCVAHMLHNTISKMCFTIIQHAVYDYICSSI